MNFKHLVFMLAALSALPFASATEIEDQKAATCKIIRLQLLPIVYELETAARLSAQKNEIVPELKRALKKSGHFADAIPTFAYSLAKDIQPQFVGTTQYWANDPHWSPAEGVCTQYEYRNQTYAGRDCVLGIFCKNVYNYDQYCVRKLMPEQVDLFNGAFALIRQIPNYYYGYESPAMVPWTVKRFMEDVRKIEAKLCY